MKKAPVFLVLILALIVASCTKEVKKNTAINAIPVRSALVVRINNLMELNTDLTESVPGAALQNTILFTQLNSFSTLLKKLTPNATKQIRAFGGFDQSGAGNFGWIWSVNATDLNDISAANLAAHGTVSERKFGPSTIVTFTTEELTFFFAKYNQILLLSTYENLIESGLKQLESDINLSHDAHFMSALKTANAKDPCNILIQYKQLPTWLAMLFDVNYEWTANFATWSALDLDLNKTDVNFTGITLAPDSASTYLEILAAAGKGTNNFTQIVPQNAAMAISQTCKNVRTWQEKYSQFLGAKNLLKKRNNTLANLKVDPLQFAELVDEEIGTFYSSSSLNNVQNKNGFIRFADQEAMKQFLQPLSSRFSENYRGINIAQFNAKLALPLTFGKLFSHLTSPYYFFHNNFVLFCNNLDNAKIVINNLKDNRTWENSNNFQQLTKLRDDDAQLVFIGKNPDFVQLTQKELTNKPSKKLAKATKDFAPIHWVIAQLKAEQEAAYSEIILLNETQTKPTPKQYWGIDLDAPIATKPVLVKNHYTNANEIAVQDQAHNLYLIDANGKTLWKAGLDGPILGTIHQADLYQNNKLQLVFNTQSKLYVIDRNGNNVGDFPVTLPKKATAPMAVFDYEKTRNYRFVVPCGKKLVNFNKDAKEVTGWKFKKAKADIVTQPKHAIIKGKDFIYTADARGNVYLVNRRGEIRTPISKKLNQLASPIFLVKDKSYGGKLNVLTKSGYTLSLFMTDEIDSLQPFGDKPKFMNIAFSSSVYAAENEVFVRNAKENFDAEFDENIIAAPEIFSVNGKNYYVIYTSNNQIWVYGQNGTPLPGMPLYGTHLTTFGKTTGKPMHLITATEQGTLLDYKLAN